MTSQSEKNIGLAFILNLCFSIIELIGGLWTGSYAISSDSLHDFGDCISIFISWMLEKKSTQKPNEFYTYGYKKFSVLGGLVNSFVLIIISVFMLIGAINKFFNPEEINYNGVLILAVIGVFFNGLGAYKTIRGEKINEKAVGLHLLEDVLGWLSTLIIAFFMKIFDAPILDPILSIFITCFILFNALKNIKKIFEIFLDKAPDNITPDQIKNILLNNDLDNKNILLDVHHIHLWTDGTNNFSTLHIKVCDTATKIDIINLKNNIHKKLLDKKINHATIEFEFETEICDEPKCDKLKNENKNYLSIHNHNHDHNSYN